MPRTPDCQRGEVGSIGDAHSCPIPPREESRRVWQGPVRLAGLGRVSWALGWVERRVTLSREAKPESGSRTHCARGRTLHWAAAPEGSLEEGAGSLLSKVGLQREKTLTSHACLWLSFPDAASGEIRAHLPGETEAWMLVGLTQRPQQLLGEPGSGALPGMGKPGVRQGFLGEGVRRQEAQDWWG